MKQIYIDQTLSQQSQTRSEANKESNRDSASHHSSDESLLIKTERLLAKASYLISEELPSTTQKLQIQRAEQVSTNNEGVKFACESFKIPGVPETDDESQDDPLVEKIKIKMWNASQRFKDES